MAKIKNYITWILLLILLKLLAQSSEAGMLSIQEVPSSPLNPVTTYPDIWSDFHLSTQANAVLVDHITLRMLHSISYPVQSASTIILLFDAI